jgi:hypothetical protein
MFFSALCSLLFSFFFASAKQQAGWSRGTGAYVLDMSPPPPLDLARHFIFRSSRKLSALAPADEHFSHTRIQLKLDAVKEREKVA